MLFESPVSYLQLKEIKQADTDDYTFEEEDDELDEDAPGDDVPSDDVPPGDPE
jgi:hypothetical protein